MVVCDQRDYRFLAHHIWEIPGKTFRCGQETILAHDYIGSQYRPIMCRLNRTGAENRVFQWRKDFVFLGRMIKDYEILD